MPLLRGGRSARRIRLRTICCNYSCRNCPSSSPKREHAVARATDKAPAQKNTRKAKPILSNPGRELRRTSEKIAVSGEKPLTRRDLELSRQNEGMAKPNKKPVDQKNGHSPKSPVTPLGKELRRLREKYIASGGKLLNRRELEREVAERRGSR